MDDRMSEIEERVAQQAGLSDEELPLAPDPNLKFWKDTAKGLLGESVKSIEETAKQIIGVAGILGALLPRHRLLRCPGAVGRRGAAAVFFALAPVAGQPVGSSARLLPSRLRHQHWLLEREQSLL
jgi:hypothetical protein